MGLSDSSALASAQRKIGTAMAACAAMWFAPVVSGVACNLAEAKLVRLVLADLGASSSDSSVDNVFWFFRKKMLFLNAATYVPYLGVPLQIVEVYALGQFTMACACDRAIRSYDEVELQRSWETIERNIFSGERIIGAYEEYSGYSFPGAKRSEFIAAVTKLGQMYMYAARVPGVSQVQSALGETARRTVHGAKKVAKQGSQKLITWMLRP